MHCERRGEEVSMNERKILETETLSVKDFTAKQL